MEKINPPPYYQATAVQVHQPTNFAPQNQNSYNPDQYNSSSSLIGGSQYGNPYHALGVVTQPPDADSIRQFPNSYSSVAWFTCLFCCWPLGLVSIIKSNEVNKAISEGDVTRAQLASKSARNYAIASVIGGLFVLALVGMFTFGL